MYPVGNRGVLNNFTNGRHNQVYKFSKYYSGKCVEDKF